MCKIDAEISNKICKYQRQSSKQRQIGGKKKKKLDENVNGNSPIDRSVGTFPHK